MGVKKDIETDETDVQNHSYTITWAGQFLDIHETAAVLFICLSSFKKKKKRTFQFKKASAFWQYFDFLIIMGEEKRYFKKKSKVCMCTWGG